MESPQEYRIVRHFSEKVLNPTDRQAATATKSSHQDDGDVTLIVHYRNGDDEAFLTFTADEIYAMACAEQGKPKIVIFLAYMCLKWLSV